MGYSRIQAEMDILTSQKLRAETAGMLARGEITGFEKLEADAACDLAERKIEGKLTGIRLSILDREKSEKSGRFAWAKKVKGGLIVKVGQARWRSTTERELESLQRQGITVLWVKGYRNPDGGAAPVAEVLETYAEPKHRKVTREEAHKLQDAGAMILWLVDGAELVEYA